MKFHHVVCQLCDATIFDIDELLFYRRRTYGIHHVDLKGQQPWCGVYGICRSCVLSIGVISKTQKFNETSKAG